jgi:hypothetical protein
VSLTAPERFHYPLPEAFFPPLAVASVHRSPRPELLFGAARDTTFGGGSAIR